MQKLTTTSFALLSLLSIRSWTTYELAQQMQRSLQHCWPRAESHLYSEPKKLVAQGLAQAERQYVGSRPRTVYSITPAGREALARWLAEPGNPEPTLEFEALLRVGFADLGTTEQLRTVLREMMRTAERRAIQSRERAGEYLATGGPFPHRLHIIALFAGFMLDYWQMIEEWAHWAEQEVATWPEMEQIDAEQVGHRLLKSVLRKSLAKAPDESAANLQNAADI